MLLRLVRLPLLPSREAEFLALFRESEALIRAQPGCLALTLGLVAGHPHTWCTVSHWTTAEALDAYRQTELFGQVWPATKRMLAAPPEAFSVELPNNPA